MTTILWLLLHNLSLTVSLYERPYKLPPLLLVTDRLQLPGIVFPLADLVHLSESDAESDLSMYHAMSPVLGYIEIKTSTSCPG